MINESLFDWNNHSILIAEDDECNFALLKYMFMATNVNILRAKNGAESITLCQANKDISLVLMDVKMPVMDGIEATRAIKTLNPTLPIIMQTAHVLEEIRLNCYEAGCDDFFTKPFDEERLYTVIDSYLKK